MPRHLIIAQSWLVAVAALTLCVPLFDVLAFEHAFVINLAVAVVAPHVGFAAVHTCGRNDVKVWRGLARGMLDASLMLLAPLTLVLLQAVWHTPCNLNQGLAFYALMPWASALFGSAWGAACARVCILFAGPWRLGHRVIIAWQFFLLTSSVWRVYLGPQIFVYDALWGFFPGSLYDELIAIDSKLLGFRIVTACLVGLCALVFYAAATQDRLRVLMVVLAASATGLVLQSTAGKALGYRTSRASLRRFLPQEIRRGPLRLHLAAEVTPVHAARVADEHAFRLAQLTRTLKSAADKPIDVWVYRDAAHKNQLMGASSTQMSRPWNHEIHVHGLDLPQAYVGHELAHVMLAQRAPWPLRLAARHRLLVNMALVEGMAVALAPDTTALGLITTAKALDDLNLSMSLVRLFNGGMATFWQGAPARAYVQAGAFLRVLQEQYGLERLMHLYAGASFASAYGDVAGSDDEDTTLKFLSTQYETRLRTINLTPPQRAVAQSTLLTPPIFFRPCPHEVARLREAADHAPAHLAAEAWQDVVRASKGALMPQLSALKATCQSHMALDAQHQPHALALCLKGVEAWLQKPDVSALPRALAMSWGAYAADQLQQKAKASQFIALGIALDLPHPVTATLRAQQLAMTLKDKPRHMMMAIIMGHVSPAEASVFLSARARLFENDEDLARYLMGRELHGLGAYAMASEFLATQPWTFAGPDDTTRLGDVILVDGRRRLADCWSQLGRNEEAMALLQTMTCQRFGENACARASDELERLVLSTFTH